MNEEESKKVEEKVMKELDKKPWRVGGQTERNLRFYRDSFGDSIPNEEEEKDLEKKVMKTLKPNFKKKRYKRKDREVFKDFETDKKLDQVFP